MNKIHTFELCATTTAAGYQLCKNVFYETAKKETIGCCFEIGEKLVYTYWSYKGVVVYLQKNKKDQAYANIYFRINPMELISAFGDICIDDSEERTQTCSKAPEPNALYEYSHARNLHLLIAFAELLKEFPLNIKLDQLHLNRVDITEDIYMPDKKSLYAYLKLVKKGLDHPNWDTQEFGDFRDTYSIRRASSRYQVTVYDKTQQMAGRFLHWDPNQSILRIEAALLTPGIRHMRKKYGLPGGVWYATLFSLLECNDLILSYILSKLLPAGNYYSLGEAKRIIRASNYREDRKQALIDFLTDINRHKTISMYQLKQTKSGKLRIKQLEYLGINLVTLNAREKIPFLPSLFRLLYPVVPVPYYAKEKTMYCSFEDNKLAISSRK